MFDKKTIDAYKSIGPSDKMKENILRQYAEHKKKSVYSRLRPMAGIAACFIVVLLAVSYYGSNPSLTIKSEGEKVSGVPMAVTLEDVPYTQSAQSISMFRMVEVAMNSIALEIDIGKQTEISVSGGTLLLNNAELGKAVYAGETCIVDTSSLVYWSIDGLSQTDVFTLSLITNGETTNLLLTFDKNSASWMLAYANK